MVSLLRHFLHQPVELRSAGLIKAGLFFQPKNADSFENAQSADTIGIGGIFRGIKTDRNVAHGSKVVDFVWLNLLNDTNQIGRISQITIVKDKIAF